MNPTKARGKMTEHAEDAAARRGGEILSGRSGAASGLGLRQHRAKLLCFDRAGVVRGIAGGDPRLLPRDQVDEPTMASKSASSAAPADVRLTRDSAWRRHFAHSSAVGNRSTGDSAAVASEEVTGAPPVGRSRAPASSRYSGSGRYPASASARAASRSSPPADSPTLRIRNSRETPHCYSSLGAPAGKARCRGKLNFRRRRRRLRPPPARAGRALRATRRGASRPG